MTEYPKFKTPTEEMEWLKAHILSLQTEAAEMKRRISDAESAAYIARSHKTPKFLSLIGSMKLDRDQITNAIRHAQSRISALKPIIQQKRIAEAKLIDNSKSKVDRNELLTAISALTVEVIRLRESIETLTGSMQRE